MFAFIQGRPKKLDCFSDQVTLQQLKFSFRLVDISKCYTRKQKFFFLKHHVLVELMHSEKKFVS